MGQDKLKETVYKWRCTKGKIRARSGSREGGGDGEKNDSFIAAIE